MQTHSTTAVLLRLHTAIVEPPRLRQVRNPSATASPILPVGRFYAGLLPGCRLLARKCSGVFFMVCTSKGIPDSACSISSLRTVRTLWTASKLSRSSASKPLSDDSSIARQRLKSLIGSAAMRGISWSRNAAIGVSPEASPSQLQGSTLLYARGECAISQKRTSQCKERSLKSLALAVIPVGCSVQRTLPVDIGL